ncbi:MAG: HAMP domain-containing methyl-accepting chemotaxis protein [Nitrospirota bacterium]
MNIRVKLMRVVTLFVFTLIAVGVAGSYVIYRAGVAGGSEVSFLWQNPLSVFLFAAAALTLLGGGIGFLIIRKISGSLNDLMNGIIAVGSGETNAISVNSSDEFGEISTIFNKTMEKINAYTRIEEENAKNQENVINFLEVVSTASDGDFTKKAPVTTDVFGSIADAFNMMTEELSMLITDVRSTAREFEEDSSNTLDLLKNMADGSETQMVQLRNATEAVDETAHATLEISEKTQDATGLSIKAVDAAQKGGELVTKSIEGMQLIRATVQQINKKMKMFSERIIEIGTISGMIGDISSRTNLLSMNASIEASRAGEAGKGFVVIAEEIRNLADRSAEATRDITSIIHSIQTEAGEITSSLEEETEIVEKQSDLASEAKSSFSEITDAVEKSREIVSEILPLSQTQRKMTSDVVLSMENVNRISLDLLRLVQDSESISGKLSGSSKELLSSVDKFRLLEAGESETEEQVNHEPEIEEHETEVLSSEEISTEEMTTGKEVTA